MNAQSAPKTTTKIGCSTILTEYLDVLRAGRPPKKFNGWSDYEKHLIARLNVFGEDQVNEKYLFEVDLAERIARRNNSLLGGLPRSAGPRLKRDRQACFFGDANFLLMKAKQKS